MVQICDPQPRITLKSPKTTAVHKTHNFSFIGFGYMEKVGILIWPEAIVKYLLGGLNRHAFDEQLGGYPLVSIFPGFSISFRNAVNV